MIVTNLEQAGWRQGSIVQSSDIQKIVSACIYKEKPAFTVDYLIVASQSCDVANTNTTQDPFIELSIATRLEKVNGNFTFNKNPRILHSTLEERTNDDDVLQQHYIELRAHQKLIVPKTTFCNLSPAQNLLMLSQTLESYVAWLAARYSRPAHPSEFNNRIAQHTTKSTRKKLKSLNPLLSGIYAEVIPNDEIAPDEQYKVNLLGLISPADDSEEKIAQATDSLNEYADTMKASGMEVTCVVKTEDQVSVALLKRFKRIYFDDLSFKDLTDLPVEIDTPLH